jgi:hypothetical protein
MGVPTARWVALSLAVVGAGCAGFSARRAALRGNQAVYDAIRTRDVARLRTLAAPEFRYPAPDGRSLDREAWLKAAAATPGEIVSVSGLHVRTELRDGGVTVCGLQHAVVHLDGKELVDDGPYCDDWRRSDGRWQIVQSYVPTF